jgi:hypothetical protein
MSLAGSAAALKGALDTAMTVKDLCDAVSGARRRETLEAIGDSHAAAAAPLLHEARDRRGEARKDKLRQAISHLDIVCTTSAQRAAAARSWTIFSTHAVDRALLDAHEAFLLLAITYSALGNDPDSVRAKLAAADTFYSLWDRRERKRISEASFGCVTNGPIPLGGMRLFMDLAGRTARDRYGELDRERDSLHQLAERIASVGVNTADLDSHLLSVRDHVRGRILTSHQGGRHRLRG